MYKVTFIDAIGDTVDVISPLVYEVYVKTIGDALNLIDGFLPEMKERGVKMTKIEEVF